ncbi:MAG: DEAD/DEAH box helicase family protein [Candidatus Margulisiibacteriota bacterium]|jgi:superfamily II DNA or RNA helicase/RNA binding exosome subunit
MNFLAKIIVFKIKNFYQSALNGSKKSRDYQLETLQNLNQLRAEGQKRAYMVYATGGGKTTTAAVDLLLFAKDFFAKNGRMPKVLWLAHRKELLEQAEVDISAKVNALSEQEDKEDQLNSELDNERADKISQVLAKEEAQTDTKLSINNDIDKYTDGVLITSIPKVRNRLDKLAPETFDYIVVDEAHHSYAPTYQQILEHFKPSFLLGLTATPWRFSDRRHIGDYFQNLAMEKDLVSLVQEGHLTSHYFHKVKTNITIDNVEMQGNDYNASSLWKAVEEGQRDQLVVDTYLQLKEQKGHYAHLGKGKLDLAKKAESPALVFAINVAHAAALAKRFRDNGISARPLVGRLSKETREGLLACYKGYVPRKLLANIKEVPSTEQLIIDLQKNGYLDQDLKRTPKLEAKLKPLRENGALDIRGQWLNKDVPNDMLLGLGTMSRTEEMAVISRLQYAKVDMIVAVDILNEGFDYPPIELVLMTRPTRSKTIYLQQLGRGSRLSDSTGKSSVLVIDFVDNMSVMNRAVTHSDIFKTGESKVRPKEKHLPEGDIEISDIEEMDITEVFGGFKQVQPGEIVISNESEGLKQIGNPDKIVSLLKAILGKPEEWPEETKEYAGVLFTHRKNRSVDVGVFQPEDVDKVAKILKKKIVKQVQPGEIAITSYSEGLKQIGSPPKLALILNAKLGAPQDWPEETKECEGVLFTHRKNKGVNVWVFQPQDVDKVAKILKIRIVKQVQPGEIVIATNSESFKRVGSPSRLAPILNAKLGKPQDWPEETKEYEGVVFSHRKNNKEDVSVFQPEDVDKVSKILKIKIVKQVQPGEIVISNVSEGLKQIGNPNMIAPLLNAILGAPQDWPTETKEYEGVVFSHRKNGVQNVWVFQTEDIDKVSKILKIKIVKQVQPGEISIANGNEGIKHIVNHKKKVQLLKKKLGKPQD